MTNQDPLADQLRRAYEQHRLERFDEAVRHYESIIHSSPTFAAAWHLNGLAHHQQGAHRRAIELLTTAVSLAPENAIVHNHLGAAWEAIGEYRRALECFQQAAELSPLYVEAHANCSAIYERLGEDDLAIVLIQKAVSLDPARHDLLARAARLLVQASRAPEAVALYQTAIDGAPADASLYEALGILWLRMDKPQEAAGAFRTALHSDPTLAGAAYNLGQALARQDLIAEAGDAFDKAARLRPDAPLWRVRRHLLCPPVFESTAAIATHHAEFERKIDEGVFDLSGVTLTDVVSAGFYPPFAMNFHGRRTHRYKEKFAALIRPLVKPRTPARRNGKLRVGFVITQGHHNLFLRCTGGIVDRLDREEFEIVVIASSECLGKLRARLKHPLTTFVPLSGDVESSMSALVAAHCDVLYHWEVGSDDINYLLPFAKAAPVQCTSWGTQVTSGVREIDYYLSSRWIETEDADADYTEQLWRLPSLPTYQYRLPNPPPTRKEYFGWSSRDRIYLCPQSLLKIHPDQDPLFGAILAADPQAIVVLKEMRSPVAGQLLRTRLQRQFGSLADRIQFLPWLPQEDYYRLVSVADVVLDAVHYSAGSSAYDMFSLGQPIVTLPGELNVGRYVQACYRYIGFTDLIAENNEEYVHLAVKIASEPDYGRWVRTQLHERSAALFQDESTVAAHGDFFRQAVLTARAANG
jgi:protein O-GlcNAc transferase